MLKIDPHRHLGGAISVKCVWKIINLRGYNYLASSLQDVEKAMTFSEREPKNFHRFLDKFRILDEIIWDEELIDMSIKCICNDLENEGIDYCWMDFSINKYMHLKWHKAEAIEFIYNSFQQHRPGKVGLILSLKYESLRETQKQYAGLIDDPNIADMLMGLDLVGDETYFDAEFYAPIFRNWRSARKMVRAHVGESQTAQNIEETITIMNATNIAHGFKCMENRRILELAIDRDIPFDMAITSNYITGVLPIDRLHPIIDMMDLGANVTIGSDDPTQFSVTLDSEFTKFTELAKNCLKSDDEIEEMINILRTNAVNNTKRFVDL